MKMIAKWVGTGVLAAMLVAGTPSVMAQHPAHDMEDAAREAAEKILQTLQFFIGAIPQYEAPELLENGDIIIRRVHPDFDDEPHDHADPDYGEET